MHPKHLGDSYDLVKRFFATALDPIAKLYAHPRFIPPDIRAAYTKVTSIPVLGEPFGGEFALFLDPDVGIHLPDGANQKTSRKHVSLAFLCEVFEDFSPTFLICYDQGHHRSPNLTGLTQRERKQQYLARQGLQSFYYVSHAPLLFVANSIDKLQRIAGVILENGIPSNKLEPAPSAGA